MGRKLNPEKIFFGSADGQSVARFSTRKGRDGGLIEGTWDGEADRNFCDLPVRLHVLHVEPVKIDVKYSLV